MRSDLFPYSNYTYLFIQLLNNQRQSFRFDLNYFSSNLGENDNFDIIYFDL